MRHILKAMYRIEAWAAGLALTVVAVALFADIVGRELIGSGIFGAQRTAVYGMIISAFLGFILASQTGRHIRIEGLDRLIPQILQPTVVRLGHLTSLAICLYLAYWSADFVAVAMEQGERSMAINILVWPIKLILPWAFLSAGMRYLFFVIDPALEEKQAELT
jgi:TRAP-type C4-dicarboxylate transport system permease small subunit